MIISEKKLPPPPPERVSEKMIISKSTSGTIDYTQQTNKEIPKEKKVIVENSETDDDIPMLDENDLTMEEEHKKSSPPEFKHLITDKIDTVNPQKSADLAPEDYYHSYQIVGGENTNDAEIELGDEDMEEVTMQSKNLNAPPKPTSPPEFKHSIKEKKPTVTTQKTIRISNVYAGLGGNSRLKIKETPSNVSQETLTNTYYKEGNNMSTEKSVQPPEKTPPPSIWQRMKNMFGSRKGK
jgi:hypothetical protein